MHRGRFRVTVGWTMLVMLLAAACGGPQDASPPTVTDPANPQVASPAGAPKVASAESAEGETTPTAPPTVVFLGDSLTAGFGLGASQAYPVLVDEALRAEGIDVRVVNAGVSGDTTAGGLSRLDWLLRQAPDVLLVALGGNDGLRGVDLETTEANLRAIVARTQATGARVILAGMLIPPNYGPAYTEQFARLYPALAEELDVTLIPFLLEGVAGDPALNQADRIHPTAEGQQRIAELVLPYITAGLESRVPPAPPQRANDQ